LFIRLNGGDVAWSVMTPVAGLQLHWPGSGQAEGPPCADTVCCPITINIAIAVTDDTSNVNTTGSSDSVVVTSICQFNCNMKKS